jgi:hypothetical protein
LCLALLFGLSIAVLAAVPVLTLQGAAEDPDVWVRFTDKPSNYKQDHPTNGYFGDAVGIVVWNSHDYPIRVTARVGDVLIGRGHAKQNLVVTKPLILDVPAEGKDHRDGLYTACIDAHKSAPEEGDYFDVGPNISEWNVAEAELLIRRLLPQVNKEQLWERGEAQSAVWQLTDNYLQSNVHEARALLVRADADPDRDCVGFPHPSNPDPNTADDTARYFSGPDLGIPMRPSPELSVSLTWEESADLDLHIIEPSGDEIYSDHPTSGSGGLLDQVSDCPGEALGTRIGEVSDYTIRLRLPFRRQEHAYWYAPPYGTYTVELSYRATCGESRGTAAWHVVIEIGNEKREFSGTIGSGVTVLVDQFTVGGYFMPMNMRN